MRSGKRIRSGRSPRKSKHVQQNRPRSFPKPAQLARTETSRRPWHGREPGVRRCAVACSGAERKPNQIRLLQNRGLRGGEGFGCCGSPDDVLIAKRSAEKAGIPHYVLDYSPEFEDKVINYFVNSYVAGETPNPCLACNRYIKFDKLKTFADSLGAAHL